MARSAPNPCAEHGCPELVHGESRCEAHLKPHKRDYTNRDTSEERKVLNKFYSSRSWQVMSKAVRKRQPLCIRCKAKGLVRPADMVDHIKPVRIHPELRLKVANLQPLCNPCHALKTNEDKRLYKI